MNPKKNKKLCYHCEGEIDKDAIYCLYCGADLNQHHADAQASVIPEPLYRAKQEFAEEKVVEELKHEVSEEEGSLLSFILLLVGSLLLIFSFFLLFFSTDGYLTLKWDASFWVAYLLIALPLVIFGLRLLKKN